MLSLVLLIQLLVHADFNEKSDQRFQIYENHKFGFIDENGKIVIKPKFLSAGEFSEGLAAVRLNGTYGFIDLDGQFVIQPQFDFATPFQEGISLAYVDGKPFYINKNGDKIFDFPYQSGGQFQGGRAIVRTFSEKLGYVNKQGKLIIDTAYKQIYPFINGMAIVMGHNHQPDGDEKKGIKQNFEFAIIDTLGNFIIPYGKYESISGFDGQYFEGVVLRSPGEDNRKTVIADTFGKIYITNDDEDDSFIYGMPKCGLVRMFLYKNRLKKDNSYSSELSYEGFVNLEGKLIINDTTYDRTNNFSDGFSFVVDYDNNHFIIDTTGNVVFKNIDDFLGDGFVGGKAFLSIDGKWGLIDRNLNFVVKPQFEGIAEIGLIDDYFFFEKDDPNSKNEHAILYGIANINGEVILEASMRNFDRAGFQGDLLKCDVQGRLTYINRKGEIVWQKTDVLELPSKLNIDFMNRGYFYAYSDPVKHDVGGFGGSHNYPKKIEKSHNFSFDDFRVVVRSDVKTKIHDLYDAMTVYVVNGTGKTVLFNAQDSRLYMKVQALDKDNHWKDIEYLPSSWCGNSYHTLALDRKKFWAFSTPVYEGDFKTKLRIELKFIDPESKGERRYDRKELTVYSNVYEASINPGQFWRKNEYYPQGIMDPYND